MAASPPQQTDIEDWYPHNYGEPQRTRRILLLDEADDRVRQAAQELAEQQDCLPCLVCSLGWPINGVDIVGPTVNELEIEREIAIARACRETHIPVDQPSRWKDLSKLEKGAWLLALGYVDGAVAGAHSSTADVVRAGLKTLRRKDASVSGFFLLRTQDRIIAFADCAVIPNPDSEQLANIAVDTATNYERLVGEQPIVAFLSFSTKGSASHEMVEKVEKAVALASERRPDLVVDGELQFDAAVCPTVAQKKAAASPVAGSANVFIFPNLDAANIAYKIMQREAGAQAVGPILQGFRKPWLDLSRGCTVAEIVRTARAAASLAANG